MWDTVQGCADHALTTIGTASQGAGAGAGAQRRRVPALYARVQSAPDAAGVLKVMMMCADGGSGRSHVPAAALSIGGLVFPALDPRTKKLPFQGDDRPYLATMAEVHARFVRGAPSQSSAQRRATIWRAFRVWHGLARAEFPGCRYWLSGSFLTDKECPSDIDVVVVIGQSHVPSFQPITAPVRALFSHLDVYASQPAGREAKLQPMGSLVDGFYCPDFQPEAVAVWQSRWSTEFDKATQAPTGARMGYLEVRS